MVLMMNTIDQHLFTPCLHLSNWWFSRKFPAANGLLEPRRMLTWTSPRCWRQPLAKPKGRAPCVKRRAATGERIPKMSQKHQTNKVYDGSWKSDSVLFLCFGAGYPTKMPRSLYLPNWPKACHHRPVLFNFTCMEMTNDSNSRGLSRSPKCFHGDFEPRWRSQGLIRT